jgi:hypothetical protein
LHGGDVSNREVFWVVAPCSFVVGYQRTLQSSGWVLLL